MLVLVTRPEAQAAATVDALAAMGHEALVDPVLEIERLPVPWLDPTGVAAVVLTSANAVPALPAALRHGPVFAVGSATAAAARALGADRLVVGDSDGQALALMITGTLQPTAGTVLHLGGEVVRPELARTLGAAGFLYRHVPVYRARPSLRLRAATCEALIAGKIGAALFFSPRSAAIWADLALAQGLADRLADVSAVCISARTAAGLRRLTWRDVAVAERPELAALLRCLEAPER